MVDRDSERGNDKEAILGFQQRLFAGAQYRK